MLLQTVSLIVCITAVLGKPDPQQQGQSYPYPYPPHPGIGQPQYQHPPMAPAPPPLNIASEGKSCLHTFECDAANTVLSCERGKCTCPNRPSISWTRGPYPLNTAWDPNLRKCLSIKDSACDVFNPKVVFCSQGLVCKGGSAKEGFGVCASGGQKNGLSTALILTLGGVLYGMA